MREHEELAADLDECADSCVLAEKHNWAQQMRRAAALLREARPQPVPVAERPWDRPRWCDAGGRCWARFANNGDRNKWALVYPFIVGDRIMLTHYLECLPHWAIPQPPHANTTHPHGVPDQ